MSTTNGDGNVSLFHMKSLRQFNKNYSKWYRRQWENRKALHGWKLNLGSTELIKFRNSCIKSRVSSRKCRSGPLAAVKTTVLLSGSASGGAAAWVTLRNYPCTEVCPVVMEISPDRLKSFLLVCRADWHRTTLGVMMMYTHRAGV